jgi:hypothetical protein
MYTAGLVILIAAGLCFLFQAVDGLGLETRQGTGTVLAREHREAVMGHRTEIINEQPTVVPHVTSEKYILKLEIGGRQAEGVVSRSIFEAARPGDRVQVTFQKRRLTERLHVLEVTR